MCFLYLPSAHIETSISYRNPAHSKMQPVNSYTVEEDNVGMKQQVRVYIRQGATKH